MATACPQRVWPLPSLGAAVVDDSFQQSFDERRTSCSAQEASPIWTHESAPVPATPTSETAPEQVDPVALLSRPVQGFHHPRQHLFTDRLIGRFYEDSSLDAETRKASKCLAGRLGSAGCNSSPTRPSSTAGGPAVLPYVRVTANSPAVTKRSRRMLESSSVYALRGGPQNASGLRSGISARKEQVEKEIMEQQALIEELEGRVASLSTHGRGPKGKRQPGALLHEAQEPTPRLPKSSARQDSDDRPVQFIDTGYESRPSSRPTNATSSSCPAGGRAQLEEKSAGWMRKRPRQAGAPQGHVSLQCLQQECARLSQDMFHEADLLQGGFPPAFEAREQAAHIKKLIATVESLLQACEGEGFLQAPRDLPGKINTSLAEVRVALTSYTAAAHGRKSVDSCQSDVALRQSCAATGEMLEAMGEALEVMSEGRTAASSSELPSTIQEPPAWPAGSGRAVAAAAASTRGGLLVSADSSNHQDFPTGVQDENETREQAVAIRPSCSENGVYEPQTVPLRTLSVQDVACLLRDNGFEEYAPNFVAQAVDGVMLSDPHLCAADFTELGLGKPTSAVDDFLVRLVSFFLQRQQDGVLVRSRSRLPSDNLGTVLDSVKDTGTDALRGDRTLRGSSERGDGEEGGWGRGRASTTAIAEPWSSNPLLLNRTQQEVIADIALDANGTECEGVLPGAPQRDAKRMSVRLNQGVAVTIGGCQAELVRDWDGLRDVTADGETAGTSTGRARRAPRSSECNTDARVRRTSLGFPNLELDTEDVRDSDSGPHDGTRQHIPPEVDVKTSEVVLNIFR